MAFGGAKLGLGPLELRNLGLSQTPKFEATDRLEHWMLNASRSLDRILNLKTEMAEGESAVVIGSTRLPAFRGASSLSDSEQNHAEWVYYFGLVNFF